MDESLWNQRRDSFRQPIQSSSHWVHFLYVSLQAYYLCSFTIHHSFTFIRSRLKTLSRIPFSDFADGCRLLLQVSLLLSSRIVLWWTARMLRLGKTFICFYRNNLCGWCKMFNWRGSGFISGRVSMSNGILLNVIIIDFLMFKKLRSVSCMNW